MVSRMDDKGGWAIVRVPPDGATRRVEVDSTTSEALSPMTGKLLARTTGNSGGEAAWLDGAPPRKVSFQGLSIENGEHLWVSFEKGGYARLEGAALAPVRGAPKGGLPPHGILMGIVPWGPAGLVIVYERAALLVDEGLEVVRQVALPVFSLELEALGTRYRTSSMNVIATPDGSTLLAIRPDGSVLAWGPMSSG